MRKVLVGSAALSLVSGGFLLPKAMAGSSAPQEPATCGGNTDVQLSISPTVLWPPNHKMNTITLVATDNDGGESGTVNVTIGPITNSDERGPNGAEINGSGPPDVAAADATPGTQMQSFTDGGNPSSATFTFQVAAERSGHDVGSGRTYSIPVMCTEMEGGQMASGNTTMFVFVPHDQGH